MSSIINNIPSANSIASYTCYAGAAVLAGRKIGLAAGCKAVSVVTGLLGKDSSADWNKSAKEYSELAKKDAFRDLTLATGLITLGIGSKCLGGCSPKEEKTDDLTSYLTEELKKMYEVRYPLLGAYVGIVVPLTILSVKITMHLANLSVANSFTNVNLLTS
jgi:hypothetical protein